MRASLRYLLLGCLLCMMLPVFAAFAEGIHESIKEWRKMKWMASLLAALAVMVGGARASYTGLLVSSGGNLYELTSSGGLTLAASNLGISVGAITQGSHTSSSSTIWALDSSGSDLYAIALSSGNIVGITHKGSLGVTGAGLAYIGGTLYTVVYDSLDGIYDLYTINQSTGTATQSHDGVITSVDNITTDGTYLYVTESSSLSGTMTQFTTGGTNTGANIYRYSANVYVNEDLSAFDGSGNVWFFDNSSFQLSQGNGTFPTHVYTVTVDATLNTTYNGMCWGYVPF